MQTGRKGEAEAGEGSEWTQEDRLGLRSAPPRLKWGPWFLKTLSLGSRSRRLLTRICNQAGKEGAGAGAGLEEKAQWMERSWSEF